MSDELRDELQTISGIGEAKADEILDVIQNHDQEYRSLLLKAFEAAEAGDDRQAAIYLRRAGGD